MIQTENTAIVLRYVNYRDNDRMVTLLSPSRGRVDAIIRGCRKPRSHNLNAGELFALGDYMMHENGGHITITSVRLIETFYPLRNDYDRLTCGIYLLNLAEAVSEPEQPEQELFMLLLHTLSRLTFSEQERKPLLAGFLLHFSACQGFKPRLNHCVCCGRRRAGLLRQRGRRHPVRGVSLPEGPDTGDPGTASVDAHGAGNRLCRLGEHAGSHGAFFTSAKIRGRAARPTDPQRNHAAGLTEKPGSVSEES